LATGHQGYSETKTRRAVRLGLGGTPLVLVAAWSGFAIGQVVIVSLTCFLSMMALSVLAKQQQHDLECDLVRGIASER